MAYVPLLALGLYISWRALHVAVNSKADRSKNWCRVGVHDPIEVLGLKESCTCDRCGCWLG